MFKLYNLQDYSNPIDAPVIFGSDTDKLIAACKKALHNALYPYEGVYVSPNKPKFSDFIKYNRDLDGTPMNNYRLFLEQWEAENPEEAAKEYHSRKKWEDFRDKQFKIIYGIAKRHHVYLDWHGVNSVCCCPDQWMIYKGGKAFAMIKL